jgi:lysylphosphatidylglycerol synthetase-like protein (DUF2156 family)
VANQLDWSLLDELLLPAPAAPRPAGRSPRWCQAAVSGVSQLRHAPFTVGFLLVLWMVGVVTGTIGHGPDSTLLGQVGVSWHAVATGHWWTPLTSIMWCQDLNSYIWTTLLFALLVTPIELRLGARRTAGLLIAGQVGGALLGIAVIRLGVAAHDPWLQPYETALTVVPSIGAVGASLAASARLTALWRRRVRLTVLSTLVMLTMYIGRELDVLRLCGGLAGLALGAALPGRRSGRIPHASSHSETRVLVTLFAAIIAVGPLLAYFFSSTARSVFTPVESLIFLVLVVAVLLLLTRRHFRAPAGDVKAAARARGILIRGGGSTLSYPTTWTGNVHWISPDGRAAVAYRVISGIALTTGDPVGTPAARQAAVGDFAAFCHGNGWSPCFYNVTAEGRETAERLGWHTVQVAEDTVLPLPELSFSEESSQDVRALLDKAGRAGITAQWWTFGEAPIAVVEQIRAIFEEWVADRGLPELGFTLGGLAELDDPAVRCLVAIDEHRSVHGVTSWLPVYRDGAPIGWTLDFTRRRAEGFRGVTEFLIASAALSFKDEGAQFLSLPGAPVALVGQVGGSEQPASLQRLLDVTEQALEPSYGFRSPPAFAATFQPVCQPLYMAYPDLAALPSIGEAIGAAYLPHSTSRRHATLLRRLARR